MSWIHWNSIAPITKRTLIPNRAHSPFEDVLPVAQFAAAPQSMYLDSEHEHVYL